LLHHYAAGEVRATLPDGSAIALRVETRYPWDGLVRVTIEEAPPGAGINLRVPGWCQSATLSVGGQRVEGGLASGAYAQVERDWRAGDVVELELAMPARRIRGDARVEATAGRVALARGPIVYCFEGADRAARDVWGMVLEPEEQFTPEEAPELLGGVVVLRGLATRPPGPPVIESFPVVAVPYYAWANREPGPMAVWLREGYL
jgi:uncharacterized protein